MTKVKPKAAASSQYHVWRFQSEMLGAPVYKHRSTVVRATEDVEITLTEGHVLASLAKEGIGNTQKCAVSTACQAQTHVFPHAFVGFIDWTYAAAYVATKLDATGIFPAECVRYEHADAVAKLFDTPAGRLKLLEDLRKNGPKVIKLRKPRNRTARAYTPTSQRPPRNPEGVGTRSAQPQPRGAALRQATVRAAA
jgi:hypothetical protein